ncbi:ankyrin repeat domain-containing protein [Kaarinaea lacus]
MKQKNLTLLMMMVVVNAFVLSPAQSAFYKWVDKDGQVHYTQTPPRNAQMSKGEMSKALASSEKDSKVVNKLVGNWIGTRKSKKKGYEENVVVEFFMDGRFDDRTQTGSGYIQNGTGKWVLDGEMIKWDYLNGIGKWKYSGKGKHYSFIEELTEHKLTIQEPDGSVTKLVRAESLADDSSLSAKEQLRIAACNKGFHEKDSASKKWKVLIDNNCVEKAKEHVDKGLDPNIELGNKTPLTLAIELKKKSLIKFLIKNGADLNLSRKSDGATPLILAAKMGEYQLVNTLIGVGAKLDANDVNKNTALIMAAKENQEMIVKRLLSVGADVNATDGNGATALKHAKERGYRKIVNAIQDYKRLTGLK